MNTIFYYPLEVLVQRPDGIVDVLLYLREIPFMTSDWSDKTLFEHPGIVHTVLVPYPQPHFLVQGYVEAIQSCVTTYIVHQMDIKMDQFATQQRMVARQTTPPVPAFYREARYQSAYTTMAAANSSCPAMHRPRVTSHLCTMEEIQHLLHMQATHRHRQTVHHGDHSLPLPGAPPASSAEAGYCQECRVIHLPMNSVSHVTPSPAQPTPAVTQSASPVRPEHPARPTRPSLSQGGRSESPTSPEGQQGVSSSADTDSRRVVLRQPDLTDF
jgi:hypothetical protein